MTGLLSSFEQGTQPSAAASASACAGGPVGPAVTHSASGNPVVPASECAGGSQSQVANDLQQDDGDVAFPCGFDPAGTAEMSCFHAQARLAGDQEAVLVDTGAKRGLSGDQWVARVEALARPHGHHVQRRDLPKPMEVRGVGKGSQDITTQAVVPGVLEDGDDMDFTTAVIPESPLPALLGLDSLERLNGIVDTRVPHRKLYLGEDVQVVPGPKTKVLQLYPAQSGHLMMPITHYGLRQSAEQPPQRKKKSIAFLEDSAPASAPASAAADANLTRFQ